MIDFASAHKLKVRDIKVVKGRGEKHGNAFIAGVVPGMRFIYLTDYLVDNLSSDELKAVVAHEIGHGKRHHLWIKLGTPLLVTLILFGVLFLVDAMGFLSDRTEGLVLAVPLVTFVGLVVAWGKMGNRFEHSADDYAADAVGVDVTIRSLEKLAEMNMAKRNTGRIFNILTQHPSLDLRIERLRKRAVTTA